MTAERKKILSPIKSIRAFCLECTCGDREWIKECPSVDCYLRPYRMGKNPNISKETKERARERFQLRISAKKQD